MSAATPTNHSIHISLGITNNNVSPFNGSVPVTLTVLSDDPCWFELRSSSGDCRHTSETFHLFPRQRTAREDDDSSHLSITAPDPAFRLSRTVSPLGARAAGEAASLQPRSQTDSFSIGAKAALGVGIALICIAIGAMAAFIYFRRRRRASDAEVTGCMLGNGRRGKKGAEKKRAGASSEASGNSDEPLCPIQPVFDGYPGSMGYEDVRSLHSHTQSHSTHSYSPQTPTYTQAGGYWTQERSIEREELTAARLKSQLNPSGPTVVSYGPNPVTPTPKSRVSPQPSVPSTTKPVSTGSIEPVPGHVPMMPLPSSDYTDYNNSSIPPPAPLPMSTPEPKPSPPRPQAAAPPLIVSYGPNRVTPTPKIVTPTVPPDESIVNRRNQEVAANASTGRHHHERQFSWEADSPLLGPSSMGPLPPYASTEEFEAMEKGAVRKLAEPQADAELPPTKDGFYHYTTDTVEYELPGAAPQHEPQLPFRPYQHNFQHGGPPLGAQQIDEQKFLLDDDVELLKEKARGKAKAGESSSASAGESATRRNEYRTPDEFDLGDGGLGPFR